MSTPKASHSFEQAKANRILASLPQREYERLLPDLSLVALPQGKELWNAGDSIQHAYFILSGMISLVSSTAGGASVEVAMIGREGLAGVSTILRFDTAPYQSVVQIPARALRIKVGVLTREFSRGEYLQTSLLRYTHALLMQLAQSASCNRFHTAEERLCRWLLTARDHAETDHLQLTHEFLAQMIGVPRTNVTMITGRIQKMGYVRCGRGTIHILDRRGLENFSCECYQLISDELSRHIAA